MTDDPNTNQTNTVESNPMNGDGIAESAQAEAAAATVQDVVSFAESAEKAKANGSTNGKGETIDMLMDVNLQFTVELGRTQMPVRQILELQNGSVVELDRIAGEAVDVFINEHLMARGEVVVVDDKFGVRITELISPTKVK